MKSNKLLQSIIALVFLGALSSIIFLFVVPRFQSTLDSPEVERYAFIDISGNLSYSLGVDTACLKELDIIERTNKNKEIINKFGKLITEQVTSYALTLNLEAYKNATLSNFTCTGYSENHFEVKYNCSYRPDYDRYAYLYMLNDSSYMAIVGSANLETKDFHFFFGVSHFKQGRAEVKIPQAFSGRRSSIVLQNEVVDDIGRTLHSNLSFKSVSDNGNIIGLTEDGKWVMLDKTSNKIMNFPQEISYLGGFHNGLARARKGQTNPGLQSPDDRWGYIDTTLNWKIKPIYANAEDFKCGKAKVGILKNK